MFKFKGKTDNSHQGLMLGNGFLGALIYGNDKLEFSLDRIDLWDNRLPDEFKNPNFTYSNLVKFFKTNYKEAYKLFNDCYDHPYPTKINGGILSIDYKIADDDVFSLDFEKATAYFAGKNLNFESYIDANKNVLSIKFDRKVDYSTRMPKYFYKSIVDGGLGYKKPKIYKDKNFYFLIQNYDENKKYGIAIYIKNNQFLVTVFKGNNLTKAKKLLLDYFNNQKEYYNSHLNYWNKFNSTSDISTPDESINEMYRKSDYFFASNSRKNYPMSLHGVWTQNNDELPRWKADLHNDINVQMTYDSYMKLGHFKEGKVIVDFLYKNRSKFQNFAKNFMGTDGLLIPGVMSQSCLPLGGWPQYALSPCNSIWILKVFDDYYQYTKKQSAFEKAYYFFKETEKSIFKVIRRNEEGFYEFDFHSSPEFYEDDEKSLFKHQTNFEITMLRYLYSKLIEYCKILNIDYSHYLEVLNSIADYYKDENGIMMISKDQKYDISHRHFSHILSYKNLELVNPLTSFVSIKTNIEYIDKIGHSNWIGFSLVEQSGLYAYVFDGENAYKHLLDYCKYFCHPNGFHMNCDYNRAGYNEFGPYVLTLEANMGFLRSLSDMMLYTSGGVIAIFPALPKKFISEGCSFKNLICKDGVKISAKIKGNQLEFSIKTKNTSTINLLNNFAEDPILVIDGKKQSFSSKINDIICIKNCKNIIYKK